MTNATTYPQGNCLPHLAARLTGFAAVAGALLLLLPHVLDPYLAVGMVAVLVATGIRLVRV